MTVLYLSASIFLLLTILGGLVRVAWGPAPADRLVAAQLIGTTGLALALLVGAAMDEPAAWDVALLFALLAALTITTFVRLVWTRPSAHNGMERPAEDQHL